MKAAQLDHIGIAVLPTSPLAKIFAILGLPVQGAEEVPQEQVNMEWITLPKEEAHIELLSTAIHDSAIGKYLAKNQRDGIHHLAFLVEDIKAMTKKLEAVGFQMIYPAPRKGAGEKLVNFIHPKTTGGILLELSQHS